MPKPLLKDKYADLESELIRTFLAGHNDWRPDLSYPQSHSDMSGGMRALMKKYDIQLRAIPLDTNDMLKEITHG